MKFNHSMTKEEKAEYARQWRILRKKYIPQKCVSEHCENTEYRRHHCAEHYIILNEHCDKRLYNIWLNMRARCDNPNQPRYKDYGGRGISYQPSWAHFINFYQDMQETYQEHLTLDREDNDLGYSADNCRWATYKEQNNNRRPWGTNHGK